MKKTITLLASLFFLFLLTSKQVKAQTYYQVYLCNGTTVTLHMPEETTLTAGDQVHWYADGAITPTQSSTYSTANSTDYATPTNLAVGAHSYTTRIESANGCLGDPSDPFTLYVLPDKTIALSTPTNTSYCEGGLLQIALLQLRQQQRLRSHCLVE